MPRINCKTCGKPFGMKTLVQERTMVEFGQPIPPYTGDNLVVTEKLVPKLPSDGPDLPPNGLYYMMDPMFGGEPWKKGDSLEYTGRKARMVIRDLWDAESWTTPINQFCSTVCGQAVPNVKQKRK